MVRKSSGKSIPTLEWKSNKAYMIALISWAMGLVNVIHMPRLFLKGTFLDHLISYIFVMVLMGIPMTQMELAVSQYSQKSVIGSWDLCPLFKGIGYAKTLTIILFQVYYNVLNSYFLFYCFFPIPEYETLDKCNQSLSNASYCFDFHSDGTVKRAKYESDAEKFWFEEIGNASEDFESIELNWILVGCLCATVFLVFLANCKRTESLGSFLTVAFVISLIERVIFLYFVTITPGSLRGMKNFISIDINFDRLAPWKRNSTTFVNFQMMIFSLGLGLGGFSSIAAQSAFRTPVHESPIWINLINFGNALLYPFLMANIYGIISQQTNVDIEIIKDGIVQTKTDISYVFTLVPKAFPFVLGYPFLWQFIFYSSIYLQGLCSSVLMASTVLQSIYDMNLKLRKHSVICSLVFSVFICLPGTILHTNMGTKIGTIINDITYTILLPLINVIQVVAVVFFYHILHLADDLYFMLGFPASTYFQLSLVFASFLLPMFTVLSLIHYFRETHTEMEIIIQKCLLPIILVWIPFMAMVRIIRKRKWTNIISASSKWGPPKELKESRKMFSEVHSVEEYMYEKYLRKNKLKKYE
ncbi:hypothetical protein JTB14_016637 [Gonioctena quinquepunctata]|nr:hypothetical protein JTB14_016637 [Gonioctena quinquepunctata]